LGKLEYVVKYLGQYTHRVAITNQRIIRMDEKTVTFMHKDYSDGVPGKNQSHWMEWGSCAWRSGGWQAGHC
jgi:hypothetical protein